MFTPQKVEKFLMKLIIYQFLLIIIEHDILSSLPIKMSKKQTNKQKIQITVNSWWAGETKNSGEIRA